MQFALLLACLEPVPPPLPPATGPTLSVLSYNVNFERYDERTVAAITSANADIVLLQETTAVWESAIRASLGTVYPTILFHPHDPDGGQGVLSRFPLQVHARLDSPAGMFPATCLTLDAPGGPLSLVHVHLHPPLEDGSLLRGYFTTSDQRFAEMQAYLGCFDTPPDLVAGDFNEGEGDALDLLVAAGLFDAASAFPPVAETWSWQSDFGLLTGRPDHVYYGPDWVPQRVDVLPGGASDHHPLRVDLRRALR